jgi:hypothetical protein
MSSAAAPSPELVHHMEAAAHWRLLGQVFSYPGSGWAGRIELLIECLREERYAELARAALRGSSPELWMRLFGPAGPVRTRAVAWLGGIQPGYLLAELSAFYEAFGFEPPAGCAPDQLPALLDFAAWLELKLAYACVQRDGERVEVTQRALKTFLERFVAPLAWPVYRQLEGCGYGLFEEAARLAAGQSGPEPERQHPAPEAWPDGAPPEDGSCGAFPGPVDLKGQS